MRQLADTAQPAGAEDDKAPPAAAWVTGGYSCDSPLVATIARRLKRMLEQPPHLNFVLTEIWTSLLQVGGGN